ncbi:MAG: ribulose-phosphate 3-epimerase [Saprospiraceae bacterium]|jgi:ribulose-phosphate 3-epimerase|nr:ribulose-phosphate 3-epimerase [Saprospiraceae bacterium]
MPKHLIAPSLLSCDFYNLTKDIELINTSEADWLHIDIMDGRFVPNISFGFPIMDAIKDHCTKVKDVHLMIVEPEKYLARFRSSGADVITVHYEACTHLHRTIQQIKELGALAGVALNPHTPVSFLYEVLEDIDLVLLMSVNPGFGGQKFIYRTLDKIETLKSEIISRNLNVKIEVDGGVGLQNAERILQAGADILVAGNAVFGDPNPTKVISQLKQIGHNI